ncbi:ribosomal protection-like ABC-F family protein [Oceanirhabdus sp. W0125-5]|uniref:ribosomal protection-like ABC-F family protein n=1 Tax=Oceanirhabdus sp. W0125-5 TaxID=2999116 RepID=UPI0022F3122A|nr:ABC-F family ATP-binding cassette domain-containing protein [Oceanirhabdus sp. W0125-5]WBW99183.1 ABC-F family ATP-binding cassette domain-containing protein [Oceanirhabdus sp. W0125-5]
MSLIKFNNIHKEYNEKKVLRGVNLSVERGERVALIGSNGCGKSTLLKIAIGDEIADDGQVMKEKAAKVGYLSQHMNELKGEYKNALHYEKAYNLEKKMKALEVEMEKCAGNYGSEYYEGLMKKYSEVMTKYESIDGYTVKNKIKKILLGLGLKEEVLLIPIDKLSGGEKMRVLLARILIEEPDLLILDEPTNHLDIKAIEWLEEFLKRFSGGVLIVSHDRFFLDRVINRVAELEGGTIIEKKCSYSSFIEQKKIMREYYLKEQKNTQKQIRDKKKQVQNLKSMRKFKAAESKEKEVERLKDKMFSSAFGLKENEHLNEKIGPHFQLNNIKKASKDIAWAKNLSKSFDGNSLLEDVSFHIYGGDRVAIIGANGCGKTTLLNILLGNDEEYEGTMRLGEWVKYSYLGQHISFEDEERTILEEIMSVKDISVKEGKVHISKFQFYGDEGNTKLKVLSGGEKVRVELAKMMLMNINCLILDEPTNHLDLESREAVENAIKMFKGTVISVSHDRYYLNYCVNKIIEIEDKKAITYNGNYEFYLRTKKEVLKKKNINQPEKQKKTRVDKVNNKLEGEKKKQKEMENVESNIVLLEKKLKEMEEGFSEGTTNEEYSEYGKLSEELEKLYEAWEQASAV